MFKSIVIYYSQTGNTKKIAQAIHEGITQGHIVTSRDFECCSAGIGKL